MIKVDKKYTITIECNKEELDDLYTAIVYNNGKSQECAWCDFLDNLQKELSNFITTEEDE